MPTSARPHPSLNAMLLCDLTIREHASQFSKRPDLEEFLRRLAKRAGGAADLPLAEGFKQITLS